MKSDIVKKAEQLYNTGNVEEALQYYASCLWNGEENSTEPLSAWLMPARPICCPVRTRNTTQRCGSGGRLCQNCKKLLRITFADLDKPDIKIHPLISADSIYCAKTALFIRSKELYMNDIAGLRIYVLQMRRSKNAGIVGYVEAFCPVQLKTSTPSG